MKQSSKNGKESKSGLRVAEAAKRAKERAAAAAALPWRTVGVDLGDRQSACVTLNAAGEIVEKEKIATTPAVFEQRFGGRERMRVVLEVGTHSPWVSRLLAEMGHEVIVANPRRVPLIYQSQGKNDWRDGENLARLGRSDPELLHPIRHRSRKAQGYAAALRARQALVASRTKLILTVRSLVKGFGTRLKKCSAESFPRQVREQIPVELREIALPLLAQIAQLTRGIRRFDRGIEEAANRSFPQSRLLRQVEGVGALTALAFMVRIDDPQRFRRSRQVGPFLGLTPRQDQSGESEAQLSITKAGDEYVRQLLVSSAHYILGPLCRQPSELRNWGLRLAERGGKNGKKRAVVAVARRLAVLLHRLWITGEVYQPVGYQTTGAAA